MTKRARIVRYIAVGLLIAAVLGTSGAVFITSMSRMVEQDTKEMLDMIAGQNAARVRSTMLLELRSLELQASFISNYQDIKSDAVIESLKRDVERLGYLRIGVLSPDGASRNTSGPDNNLFYREYFQQAMKGNAVISEPLQYSLDPTINVLVFAVPIKKDSHIIGVLRGAHDVAQYSLMLDMSMFGGDGHAHIVRPDGNSLITVSTDEFHDLFNTHPLDAHYELKDEPGLDGLRTGMKNGESGILSFRHESGKNVYIDYRPLGINDWYLISYVPVDAMLGRSTDVLRISIGTLLVLLIVFLYLIISIIVSKERKEQTLEKIAFVDQLTELMNWEYLRYKIVSGELKGELSDYCYIIVDIANFKMVNELIGYSRADNLLKGVACTLKASVFRDEYAIRVVSDRFCLLWRTKSVETIKERLDRMFSNLEQLQNRPEFSILQGRQVNYFCGIYPVEDARMPLGTIHEMSIVALDSIRDRKSSGYAIYDQSLHLSLRQKKELESRFDSALQNDEFIIYLQPVFTVKDKTLYGAEALVRWNHPIRGLLNPLEFIPMLEENGTIGQLDTLVFEKVCRLQRTWIDQGRPIMPISVNVSRAHLLAPSFIEDYQRIAETYRVNPSRLILEITETAFVDAPVKFKDVFVRLHELGFIIAIDDFGTGYSSLNLLYDLAIDYIKIDRKMIIGLNEGGKSETVLRHMLHMIQEIGMSSVAEGVETESQLSLLASANCTYGQGYLYAKPMPVEVFERLLEENDR